MNENYNRIRVSPKVAGLLKELGFDRTYNSTSRIIRISYPDKIILMKKYKRPAMKRAIEILLKKKN